MAITELEKNKKYLVRVAYRNGIGKPLDRKKTVHGTMKDAIVVEQSLIQELRDGVFKDMTFYDLFCAYHESKPNVKEETLRKEREIYERFLNDISRHKLDRISPYQLITLRNKIETDSGSVTQKNKAIYLVKSIYKFGNKAFGYKDLATHLEIIKPKVKEKFVYNTISPEEFDFIISFEPLENYRLLFEIYFWAGLRRGEGLALFTNDLLDTQELDIYNSLNNSNVLGPPKNEQSYRRVGIHEDLYKRLLPYSRSKHKYLLGGEVYLAPSTVNRRFTACQKLANADRIAQGLNPLPHLRIHDLRHSHATFLASQGVPVTAVSHRLGHASIGETMNTYLHLFKGDDLRALSVIENYKNTNNTVNSSEQDLKTRIMKSISGESLHEIERTFELILQEAKSKVTF